MRYSHAYIPTLKEAPGDADALSHKLLLRAGMLRPLARGIYDVLPLGLRVQRKVEQIVREEIERAGAHEVSLPVVQPAELWESSGRWATYTNDGLLATLHDRTGRAFCLGPTHEEVMTDLVRRDVRSYRELPLALYQIQTKFRDEIRPRFGLLRAREFVMMDAYSFDRDVGGASAAYWRMYSAYERIFARCGLACRPVEALTGAMGGNMSHEFQLLAREGENDIALCTECDYAANVEKASIGVRGSAPVTLDDDACPPYERVLTPGQHTVDEVAEFLAVPPERIVKTLLFQTSRGPVAALVRGDHSLNEDKLRAALDVEWVEMADEHTVRRLTSAPVGYAGPIGLPGVSLVADRSLASMVDVVTGANLAETHFRHVSIARDVEVETFGDIRNAVAGDPCPRCATGSLSIAQGIEVGQVYYLGTRYSKPMQATFLDETGQSVPFEMGCYGIGIGRTIAASVEQHHDDRGIVWPIPIAPYHVALLALDAASLALAERLYTELDEAGVEVLFDERDERPGVKFKDADLLGVPFHVVVGARGLQSGEVELKRRRDGTEERLPIDRAVRAIAERVRAELDGYQ